MPPAARILDNVTHPLPPILTPGPGSTNVLVGMLPQWRAIPAAAASALNAAKKATDAACKTLEATRSAAMGTPGAPAAIAAENAGKAAASAAMGALMNSIGGLSDTHMCTTPTPPCPVPHGPGKVIDGSSTVLVNGLPAARMGDTVVEAIGPPNKIAKGHPTTIIGGGSNSGSASFGALVAALVSAVVEAVVAEFPRPVILPDGTHATEYSPNVYVTGTAEQQAETIRQLNAIRAGEGGEQFFNDLAGQDEPQILSVIGDPARGRELHPGQQSYENCAVQSSQQIIHQATGTDNDEATMEGIAGGPPPSGYSRTGGTPIGGEEVILENGGVPATMMPGNTNTVDNALANNQGVISGHDAGRLWNDPAYNGGGHAVHTTGAVQNQNGETLAYTINDTGNNKTGQVIGAQEYADSLDGFNIPVTDNPIW
ncbi:PAAR domain-containing protein [Alphaproteobacteria bacterium KMM 3653]|uniref:PAAR domain-containing protein n=1 Tax=Harenicola maris TaxID=2841044 RepID=A0AAP2CMQ7_9RHOB|nr:PAAR domain-containing protein [Harenicola maris]